MPRKKVTKKAPKKELVNDSADLKVSSNPTLVDQLKEELKSSQSYSNLILGLIIVLIIGILLLNYFKRTQSELGGSDQTETQQTQQTGDAAPENLPGKYTIKQGDTLFSIAEKYYKDGYQYPKIVEANSLVSENAIEVGQTITIPKLETTPSPTQTPSETPAAQQ